MTKAESDYVSDVDYPTGFYGNQAPVQLALGCALNGIEAPDPAGAYRYCELGAGVGRTLTVLAAANPQAEFVGIDINPNHIAAAQQLAAAGEVANAAFLVADIAGPAMAALEPFDFVAMHGLYSWVSDGLRRTVRSFLADKLKPGGVAYLTYNTQPGWGGPGQLRRYFAERAPRLAGDLAAKADRILEELEALRAAGAPFFEANPTAGAVLDRLRDADRSYVAHEFLGPDWAALPFAEVCHDMASAGLVYAGDARVEENLESETVPAAFHEMLGRQPDRAARESVKDFITNRFFRSDLYVKPDDGAGRPHVAAIDAIRFGTRKALAELPADVILSDGRVVLESEGAASVRTALEHVALSLPEMMRLPGIQEIGRDELGRRVALLAAGEQIVPFVRRPVVQGDAPNRLRCPVPLNRLLLTEILSNAVSVVLASPVVGSGVVVTPLEACLLVGLRQADPVAATLTEIDRRGLRLGEGGRAIVEPDARRRAIEAIVPSFQAGKLRKLIELGIVADAGD